MRVDPKRIMSRHNGLFAHGGITVEVNICRLEQTKWSHGVVDKDNSSIVWDGDFETDDEAHAEFLKSVEAKGQDGVLRDPARLR